MSGLNRRLARRKKGYGGTLAKEFAVAELGRAKKRAFDRRLGPGTGPRRRLGRAQRAAMKGGASSACSALRSLGVKGHSR